MNNILIHVISCAHPSILHGKNLNIEHYVQSFQSNSFMLAMFIGNIAFCHFIPLSGTLTLTEGTRPLQIKTYWLHFLTHISAEWDENLV